MASLDHVLWIGGPAGAGKSTVARILARRHGLRWYNADAHTWKHRDRALAAGIALPPRGPGSHLYDRGPMVLDDIRALPAVPLVVAEGSPVVPEVASQGGHAVWLTLSRDVHRARLAQRHPDGVPVAYLDTWDAIDSALSGAPAHERSVRILVDGLDVADTVAAVERHFSEPLATGPTAQGPVQRRSLIRYVNRAIVEQYLSPSTTPLTPVPPEDIVRDFDCECGDPSCVETVRMRAVDVRRVILFAAPAVLADGH